MLYQTKKLLIAFRLCILVIGHLLQGESIVHEPGLLGVLEGGADGAEALGPLVLGKPHVGHQLLRVVLIQLTALRLNSCFY